MERRVLHYRARAYDDRCDASTGHWTEITGTVDDLLAMIGFAPGSELVSVHIDRIGLKFRITVDEHLEVSPCPASADGSSAGSFTGSLVALPDPSS